MSDSEELEEDPNTLIVQSIKWIAYSLVAYLIVCVGIMGNLLSLVVLTRPNLKGVMYVYLLGLAVSNLCVLITALPALYDISSGLGGGHYTTAFFQAHLKLPLINSFMASSVYIIIFMTVNRYISIYKPTDFQRLHTLKNARLSISLSFFFGIIFHIPLCFQNKVTRLCEVISEDSSDESISLADENLINLIESNQTVSIEETICVWKSDENFFVSETNAFKAYLVISEIFLRVGPIIILAILNILIIHKFLKIAQKRQSLKNRSMKPEQSSHNLSSAPSSPMPSRNTSSTTQTSSCSSAPSYSTTVNHLSVPSYNSRAASPCPSSYAPSPPSPSCTPSPCSHPRSKPRKHKVLQNSEQRMLVLVLISIIVLFVCCTTPAAILSILFSVKLEQHPAFQIFRAVANNLELLNFASNFYIYCLCSAEIRRAFVTLFKTAWCCGARRGAQGVRVRVEQV